MPIVPRPTAASIIEALGGNPHSGMCRCPAHDDNTPSLHVSEKNGRLLVKCHTGCSQEAVIGALRGMGLWPDKGQTPRTPERPSDADETAFEKYEQFHEAFVILRAAAQANAGTPASYLKGRGISSVPRSVMLLPASATRRLAGKRLWPSGPAVRLAHGGFPAMVLPVISRDGIQGAHVTYLDKSGKTKLAARERQRQLFGPAKGGYALLGVSDPSQPLLVAEGVETALSASEITGVPAIAVLSSGNMAKVTPPPCSEIIICADNDASGNGQKAAITAAGKWVAEGHVVRLALPDRPDGVEKYDWNDALLDGKDLDGLRNSILDAKRIKGPRGVQALTMEEFMDLEFPERPYLMKPWLTTSGLAMIHAQRGAAKTWLALSVAYAVATGKPLMNWTVEKKARVLYVDGELPGRLLQTRLAALGPQSNNLKVLSPDLFRRREALMPDLGDPAGREFLDTIIDRDAIDFVVLDSLSTLVRSGEENDAGPWVPIQDWALSHRGQGRTILFVHHEGRSNKPRGTSKREDILDTMIGLRARPRSEEDTDSAFDLTFTKAREFYGKDAAPLLVRLSIEAGTVEWTCQSAEQDKRERVAELLTKGWKGVDIAKELGLTKGRISQIAKEIKLKRFAA